MSRAGAPRDGDRFVNLTGPRVLPGVQVMFPFLLRKVWTSLVPRTGAARVIPFRRAAMMHNPSVTWIGHSTMLVRMDGMTFLTDPVFSHRVGPASFVGPTRLVPPGVPLAQLPEIDFVLLSHDHYDHTDLPSVAALAQRGALFIVPLGIGELVRRAGGAAIELDWWDRTEIGTARVHCVPAQHFSGRGLTDGNRRLWAGWVVQGPTQRFYHAGDTAYFTGFREIGERLGPIDLAALPIAAYDPPQIMRSVHLNPEEAVQAGVDLGAKRMVAMHFGTFDQTDEPLDEPPVRFLAAAAKHGLDRERAWTLHVGESRRW